MSTPRSRGPTFRQSPVEHRRAVERYFSATARFWNDVYEAPTVAGAIYRERSERALSWIDELSLAPGSNVLELGCGAGIQLVDLHWRGFSVEAVDPSAEMVNLARARIREAGMADAAVQIGDAHSLPYEAQSFDLVLALGVVPWLHSPALAISEVVRVLRPARYFLLSSDNARRLTHLLDPRLMPVLAPVKEALANIARRFNAWEREDLARSLVYRELARLLVAAGFSVEKRASLGFGPFTMLGMRFIPERAAIRLHHRLQTLADRGVPLLRATGSHHLVLAQLRSPP